MSKYFVYPEAGDDLWVPASPEPVTLDEALESVETFITLMAVQGHWRDCRGEAVPASQVRFVIEHQDFVSNHL
jgi:hypothetical protein